MSFTFRATRVKQIGDILFYVMKHGDVFYLCHFIFKATRVQHIDDNIFYANKRGDMFYLCHLVLGQRDSNILVTSYFMS